MPEPGWQPDPVGRHQYRWYDGNGWTGYVGDFGVTSVDPVPATAVGAPTYLDGPPITESYGSPGGRPADVPLDDGSSIYRSARERALMAGGASLSTPMAPSRRSRHPALLTVLALIALGAGGFGIYRLVSRSSAPAKPATANAVPGELCLPNRATTNLASPAGNPSSCTKQQTTLGTPGKRKPGTGAAPQGRIPPYRMQAINPHLSTAQIKAIMHSANIQLADLPQGLPSSLAWHACGAACNSGGGPNLSQAQRQTLTNQFAKCLHLSASNPVVQGLVRTSGSYFAAGSGTLNAGGPTFSPGSSASGLEGVDQVASDAEAILPGTVAGSGLALLHAAVMGPRFAGCFSQIMDASGADLAPQLANSIGHGATATALPASTKVVHGPAGIWGFQVLQPLQIESKGTQIELYSNLALLCDQDTAVGLEAATIEVNLSDWPQLIADVEGRLPLAMSDLVHGIVPANRQEAA